MFSYLHMWPFWVDSGRQNGCRSGRTTDEYTDLHIPVSIFPTTAAIVVGFSVLVKGFCLPFPPTKTDQHNSIMADQYISVMAAQETG